MVILTAEQPIISFNPFTPFYTQAPVKVNTKQDCQTLVYACIGGQTLILPGTISKKEKLKEPPVLFIGIVMIMIKKINYTVECSPKSGP